MFDAAGCEEPPRGRPADTELLGNFRFDDPALNNSLILSTCSAADGGRP
jgi:hypothetical protein